MTLKIKTTKGIKTFYNINIVRKPTSDEDYTYNYVCVDNYNQKRYFNELLEIRG